jgi:hypothetical protein
MDKSPYFAILGLICLKGVYLIFQTLYGRFWGAACIICTMLISLHDGDHGDTSSVAEVSATVDILYNMLSA